MWHEYVTYRRILEGRYIVEICSKVEWKPECTKPFVWLYPTRNAGLAKLTYLNGSAGVAWLEVTIDNNILYYLFHKTTPLNFVSDQTQTRIIHTLDNRLWYFTYLICFIWHVYRLNSWNTYILCSYQGWTIGGPRDTFIWPELVFKTKNYKLLLNIFENTHIYRKCVTYIYYFKGSFFIYKLRGVSIIYNFLSNFAYENVIL